MASPKVKARSDQWRKAHNGDDPTVTFDDRAFRNVSSEHIDTTVVARMMQTELINASDMTFKPSGDQAAQVHKELNAQNSADSNVSQDTAAQMGQETGACYMILGTVNRMKDAIEGKAVLTYYVTCQLINVEKGTVIWQGQDDSIKKYITQASAKL
jgi:PBP1b-binding outer membrane lipoprotein LpoB